MAADSVQGGRTGPGNGGAGGVLFGDMVFWTYTAYYWEICFRRYDGSENHTVCILDDGTVFFAEAELNSEFEADSLEGAADYLLGMADAEAAEKDTEGENLRDWTVYSGMDVTGMQWKSLVEVMGEEENCYVLQAYSDSRYLYAVILQ